MPYKLVLFAIALMFLLPANAFARVTPNDIYQEKMAAYQVNLSKISDPVKRKSVELADQTLKEINQRICNSFDADNAKMAAILEEEKSRQNISSTRVAYGQGDTPLDTAAYYLNYAAEAVAYQKSQDYTPNISGVNLAGAVNNSSSRLSSDLNILKGKILKAKAEIKKALDYYEK